MSDPNNSAEQRGLFLLQQDRYEEAARFFREALASDTQSAWTFFRLALCELNLKQPKEALREIDAALALEPNEGDFHALRALALAQTDRLPQAVQAAETAIAKTPSSVFAHVALGQVRSQQKEWALAEQSARQALALDAEDENAAALLATTLRIQNKRADGEALVAQMLARNPESEQSHIEAGWSALRRGDHRKAEDHFLEALRIDPLNEYARAGLKESFKSRSPLYRMYLEYAFFMQRFTAKHQWLLIIGLLLMVKFARALLGPVGVAIGLLYLLFVFFVHFALPLGNLQLLLDPRARHALDPEEKQEATFVSGSLILGLLAVAVGLLAKGNVLLIFTGLCLVGMALPLRYIFTNRSAIGRYLFGSFVLFILLTILMVFLPFLQPVAFAFGGVAALLVMLTTWLSGVPSLYRPH